MYTLFVAILIASVSCGALALEPDPVEALTVVAPRLAGPSGDKIVFRSGRSLEGVRILSMSQVEVKVEVLSGLPPLVLPASQIASVRYGKLPVEAATDGDDIGQLNDETAPELLPATKIDPTFSRILESALGSTLRTFSEEDVVAVLRTIATEQQVAVTFSAQLLELPDTRRQCTLTIVPGQSLHSFLQESLQPALPWLKIDYAFDRIQVSLGTE